MLERVDPYACILSLARYEDVGERWAPFNSQGRRVSLDNAKELGPIAVRAVRESGVDGEEVREVGGYGGGDGGEIRSLRRGREAFVALEDIPDDTALGAGGEREGWVRVAGEGGGVGKGGCSGEDEGIGHFEIGKGRWVVLVKVVEALVRASYSYKRC